MKYIWMLLCFVVGALVGGFVMRGSDQVELKQDVVVMTRDQKAVAITKGTVLRKDKWGEDYYLKVELDKTKVAQSDRELDAFTDVVEDALLHANFKIVPAEMVKAEVAQKSLLEKEKEAVKKQLDAMQKKLEAEGAEYNELFKKYSDDSK